MNIIEKLLDENNHDDIVFYNLSGEKVVFSQIAVVYYCDEPYFILHPVNPAFGLSEDEAVVFKIVDDDNGEQIITMELNDEVIDEVFAIYAESCS